MVIVIVIVIQIVKSLNYFVILDGYMKTHSGDPPGESECIGRIKNKDDRFIEHNNQIIIIQRYN